MLKMRQISVFTRAFRSQPLFIIHLPSLSSFSLIFLIICFKEQWKGRRKGEKLLESVKSREMIFRSSYFLSLFKDFCRVFTFLLLNVLVNKSSLLNVRYF